MLRSRTSAQIRSDAVKVAIRKAKSGCHSCAQRYFELAKQHGATEEEISRTIEASVGPGETGMSRPDACHSEPQRSIPGRAPAETGMSRRQLLKLATAVIAGVTLGSSELFVHRAEAASYYWGTDSNTATMLGIPQNFYVGRFGYGTTSSTYFFNTQAAQAAGESGTYLFWGLEGPGLAPSGVTSYQWGSQQASAAVYSWSNNPNAPFVGGYTLFADIESGFGGWTAGKAHHSSNRQVVEGFLDGIANASTQATPFHPGIYIAPPDWRGYVGTAFRPGTSFVLWISGCYSCNSSICAPCDDTCWTTLSDVAALVPTVTSTILGGSQAVLWQYWLDPPCGCGDFDVAIQDPVAGFKPVSSSTTYASVC